jgi:hypothetical protein
MAVARVRLDAAGEATRYPAAMTRSSSLHENIFVTSQGYDFGRFRRALDHGNVTEALSAASARFPTSD